MSNSAIGILDLLRPYYTAEDYIEIGDNGPKATTTVVGRYTYRGFERHFSVKSRYPVDIRPNTDDTHSIWLFGDVADAIADAYELHFGKDIYAVTEYEGEEVESAMRAAFGPDDEVQA